MTEIAPLSPSPEIVAAARPAAIDVATAARRPAAFAQVLEGARPGPTPTASEGLGERFEAAVLTPLVTAILPPEDSTVWGGQAGKLWRGLFAEELAAATAASGGIGIAELIDDAVASRYQPAAQADEG